MKKVLSIVLSIVMVLCMMPAMAFAGTTATFTDEADINHDAAVGTLVALGVFEGYPDGSFQPAKVVTRAEMAKIIATVLNGGEAPVLSASTTSYTDTKGHWAAPYIEYCTSLGIVEGFNGAFSPDAPVTAEAAAKMILVAQGYNATVEGMTGAQWASNTNVLANANGYYAELKDIATDAGAAREHVAQMINNALAATVIVKTNSVNKETGAVTVTYTADAKGVTMIDKYFNQESEVGVLSAAEYKAAEKVYVYTVGKTTYESTADYSVLFGQNVKVLSDKTATPKVKDAKVVLGMFAEKSSVVATGLYGDFVMEKGSIKVTTVKSDSVIKLGTVEYKLEGKEVPTLQAEYTGTTTPAVAVYNTVKLIDNNANGKVDAITYAPAVYDQVKFIGTEKINLVSKTALAIEDTIYTGVAKDDHVVKTKDFATGKDVLTKLDVIEQVKVESVKDSTYVLGGVSYKNLTETKLELNEKYNIVAINGYIVAVPDADTKANVSDYAIVTGSAKVAGDGWYNEDTYTATLLKTDGTTVTVPTGKVEYGFDKYAGALVKYTVDADGIYTLEKAAEVKAADTKLAALDLVKDGAFVKADATKATPATIAAKRIADDAVIFVETAPAKKGEAPTYSVMTGAQLAAKSDAKVSEAYSAANANGFHTVVLAKITSTSVAADTVYAYVTDSVQHNADGSKVVTLSTGSFTVAKDSKISVEGIVKGKVVAYTVDGTALKSLELANLIEGTVKAIDGAYYQINDDEYTLAADVTVIYVDSAKTTVAADGVIQVATQTEDGATPKSNVGFIRDKEKTTVINVIVVDVNNDISAMFPKAE